MCSGQNVPQNPNGKPSVNRKYDSVEFSLNGVTVNYDVDSNQATFLTNVTPEYHYLEIYSSQEISIRFNSTDDHAVTISANTLRVFDRQIFKNLFLSNAGASAATVRLYMK